MNTYVEGFLKLKITPQSEQSYLGPEKTATQIQKCTILKSGNVTYSNKLEIPEKRDK